MYAPEAPEVQRPVMFQHWRMVTFLHWRYPAGSIQPLLPAGLTVQTRDGTAWLGIIPLLMDEVRAPGVPALPWLSRFPETNLRTYVTGPDGREGIWFFSLDAARAPAVVAARAGFGSPYRWARMSLRRSVDQISYRSLRRNADPISSALRRGVDQVSHRSLHHWSGRPGARCDARVELGAPFAGAELGPTDHFLTARYRLYSVFAGRLVAADAAHGPWPLRRASLIDLDQSLIQAAGLPAPSGDPLVHASDGVRVRVGMWHPV